MQNTMFAGGGGLGFYGKRNQGKNCIINGLKVFKSFWAIKAKSSFPLHIFFLLFCACDIVVFTPKGEEENHYNTHI